MILFLNSPKGGGKDTTGKLLKEEFERRGYEAQTFAFADRIKEILAISLGISVETLNELKNNKTKLYVPDRIYKDVFSELTDFRKLLQNFGTDAMHKYFGSDVWVEQTYEDLEGFFHNGGKVAIITDFRLLREFDYMDEQYPYKFLEAVYIKPPKDINTSDEHSNHKSENELYKEKFKFDKVLDNSKKDLADLSKQVKEYVDTLEQYL